LRLLKDKGHDVTAYYLKIWLQDEFSFLGECPWEEDLKFARDVCEQTNVPLEVVPLQTEYWDNVVSYTIEEIKEGRTPNPDIFCNSLIKFGEFYDKINVSFEKVASGHYARVEKINEKYCLKTSIGKYKKTEIRGVAEKYNLPTMARRDSQGICFLGQIKFNEFIKHHLGEIEGDIIDVDSGKVLGKHPGYYYYTIGQRSGLRLGGGPWFVVKKDVKNNFVYVSKKNKAELERNQFNVGKLNWISGIRSVNKDLKIKIRHGAHFYNCMIEWMDEATLTVKLTKSDKGIAPGQFAVFYNEDICLGGGVILQDSD
jgi:tRNA U34 2-thiouridine synthase MnmA/TrmU